MASIPTIPISSLYPHPKNPRKDLGDLAELTDSIKAQGVRQNLLAMPRKDGGYHVILGHRRLAAATLAGLTEVPCVVDDTLDDTHAIELMLVENLQRADLTDLEEGDAYCELLDLGSSITSINKTTGRSRNTISKRVKVAQAPKKVREAFKAEQLTFDGALEVAEYEADHPGFFDEHLDKKNPNNWNWLIKDEKKKQADEELPATIRAAGHRLIDNDNLRYVSWNPDDWTCLPVGELGLKPEEHASCPGAVARIDSWNKKVTYGCDRLDEHAEKVKKLRDEALNKRRQEQNAKREADQAKFDEAQKARQDEFDHVHKHFLQAHESRRDWLIEQLRKTDNPATLYNLARTASNMHALLDEYVTQWEIQIEGSFRSCWCDSELEDVTEVVKTLPPVGFAIAAALAPIESVVYDRWIAEAMSRDPYEGDEPICHVFSAYTQALETVGYPLTPPIRKLVDQAQERFDLLNSTRRADEEAYYGSPTAEEPPEPIEPPTTAEPAGIHA